MNSVNIIVIVIVGIAALALVIFPIFKNYQDKNKLNPDADNSVEETIADKERRRDKI